MRLLITVIGGALAQLTALYLFNATSAEGFLAYLLGLLVISKLTEVSVNEK